MKPLTSYPKHKRIKIRFIRYKNRLQRGDIFRKVIYDIGELNLKAWEASLNIEIDHIEDWYGVKLYRTKLLFEPSPSGKTTKGFIVFSTKKQMFNTEQLH